MKKLLFLLLPLQVFSAEIFLGAIEEGAGAVYDLALRMRVGCGGLPDDPHAALALQAMALELSDAQVMMYDSFAGYLASASPSILTDDMGMRKAHADYYRRRAQSLQQGLPMEPIYLATLMLDKAKKIPAADYFMRPAFIGPKALNQVIPFATAYLALLRYPDHALPHMRLGKLLTNAYESSSILKPDNRRALYYVSRAFVLNPAYRDYFITLCDALRSTDAGLAILEEAQQAYDGSTSVESVVIKEALDNKTCAVS